MTLSKSISTNLAASRICSSNGAEAFSSVVSFSCATRDCESCMAVRIRPVAYVYATQKYTPSFEISHGQLRFCEITLLINTA